MSWERNRGRCSSLSCAMLEEYLQSTLTECLFESQVLGFNPQNLGNCSIVVPWYKKPSSNGVLEYFIIFTTWSIRVSLTSICRIECLFLVVLIRFVDVLAV